MPAMKRTISWLTALAGSSRSSPTTINEAMAPITVIPIDGGRRRKR